MRLTLRTLLAYEHGLLNQQQSALIAQKIEQSPFVKQLLRHIHDRAARPELVPLSLAARGSSQVGKVAQYLDHQLPPAEVVKFENDCFASDRLLAEVAACHQILAQWLSRPAPLDAAVRQSLYEIVPGAATTKLLADACDQALLLPISTESESDSPRHPVERPSTEQAPPEPRRRVAASLAKLTALAATVVVLVTWATLNRKQVHDTLVQHWNAPSMVSAEDTRPGSFVADASRVQPIALADPAARSPRSEVATTAYHLPLDPSPAPESRAATPLWEADEALGVLVFQEHESAWVPLRPATGLDAGGRLVICPTGKLIVAGDQAHYLIDGPAEVVLTSAGQCQLKYGRLRLQFPGDRQVAVDTAGQTLTFTATADAQIELLTTAVELDGIDYSQEPQNQEVVVAVIAGDVQLQAPCCRGAVGLEQGQTVAIHATGGVRSQEPLSADGAISGDPFLSVQPDRLLQAMAAHADPVAFWEEVIHCGDPAAEGLAAECLLQLGQAGALVQWWGRRHEPEHFARHGERCRRYLAQDTDQAQHMRHVLESQLQETGAVVYRLMCGFSPLQRTAQTQEQLEALSTHPNLVVRHWAQFQYYR